VAGHPPRAVKIPPGNGRVEIHYTALSLQAPEKNRFRYRLSGVDSEWVEAGPQRVATYNNVLPGDYRFEVLASNNDGVWNQEPATIGLSIAPHLWQTWWFRSGLVLAPLALVALVARLRVARLRALEKLRIRIAADLHDDVGARLTKLAMVTELADRETQPADAAKPHLQQIASTARDITRAMDEVVWTINPRNDTLDSFATYLFHYAEEYFRDTGVRCRLDLPVVLPERKLSTEVRHNLFMAVKEALNNVLKHAAATEVRIALSITDTVLSLSITDNGHGLKSGQGDPTGVGIDIMRGRMQRVGGEFLWQSGAGGTKITLVLPGHGRR
jgi:signal transduction histidine kinase